VFSSPEFFTAVVIIGLAAATLFVLLSYHNPRRNYIGLGVGVLVVATTLGLLARSFADPGAGTALALLVLMLVLMAVLLTYQSRRWGHVVWWLGVVLFLLGLPFMGAGRGDLALLSLVGGPGLLMLVAALQPEVPASYARLGAPEASGRLTPEELRTERSRYTRLAGTITVASLAGVWLFGGIPTGPEEQGPISFTVDPAAAERGAALFQQYGCVACHSTGRQVIVGPGLGGSFGTQVRFTDGSTAIRDEAYVREAITQPDARTVNGFPSGVMLSAIQGNLPEISQPNNLTALVEYIKSLAQGASS
jgi:hypothetical protein